MPIIVKDAESTENQKYFFGRKAVEREMELLLIIRKEMRTELKRNSLNIIEIEFCANVGQ